MLLRERLVPDWQRQHADQVSRLQNEERAGRTREALAIARRIVDRFGPRLSRDPSGKARAAGDLLRLANLEEALGELDAAVEHWEQAMALDPDRVDRGWLEIAQIRMKQHDALRAEAAFLKAASSPAREIALQARAGLIALYGTQKRLRELDEQFQKVAGETQLTYHQALHWTICRSPAWDAAGAEQLLVQYIEQDSTGQDRASRKALAELWVQVGKLDEAANLLSQLPADDDDLRAIRAELALKRGDTSAAQTLVERGAANHPTLASLRGRLALARRDPQTAISHFQIAAKKDPYARENVLGLGQALRLAGNLEEAQTYLDRAKRMDELGSLLKVAGTDEGFSDPAMARRLARACEQLDRLDQARTWYRLALVRDPLDTAAQEGLFRIRQAEPQAPVRDSSALTR
jgi:tetratricopeptide (TPR) repeat protein